jgi:hypothetical protein
MQPLFFETDGITDASIPVTLPNFTVWKKIYVLPIGSVNPGDLIDVFAETQFKNNLGYNAEVVTQISILPGPTPSDSQELYDISGQGADYICKPNGENVDATRHYYQLSRGNKYRCPMYIQQAYLHLRARCRSTLADGNPITVGWGYGKISAFVWKP